MRYESFDQYDWFMCRPCGAENMTLSKIKSAGRRTKFCSYSLCTVTIMIVAAQHRLCTLLLHYIECDVYVMSYVTAGPTCIN